MSVYSEQDAEINNEKVNEAWSQELVGRGDAWAVQGCNQISWLDTAVSSSIGAPKHAIMVFLYGPK